MKMKREERRAQNQKPRKARAPRPASLRLRLCGQRWQCRRAAIAGIRSDMLCDGALMRCAAERDARVCYSA